MREFVIAVDFDGTIVGHAYPDLGAPVAGAIRWLKRWQELGAKIILLTMRCDNDRVGPVLTQAVDYLRSNEIKLWGINSNPQQATWTDSPKVYANIYVDDAGFGCPTYNTFQHTGRPVVNWDIVGPGVELAIFADAERLTQRVE